MGRSGLRQSFPFVASPQARVLILGSMPGERSLQAQQYYAHPQNIFWEIMGELFGAGRKRPYPERLECLKEQKIALWDIACQCRRNGSLDSEIRIESVVPNNFEKLFAVCPQIETVFFNGHKAEQLFRRLVLKNLSEGCAKRLRFVRLPSTSPAHASLSRDQKKARWYRNLKTALA